MYTLADLAALIAKLDGLDEGQEKTLLRKLRDWAAKGVLVEDVKLSGLGTKVFLPRNVPLVRVIVALIARVGVDPSSQAIGAVKMGRDLLPIVRAIATGMQAAMVISLDAKDGWKAEVLMSRDPPRPKATLAAIYLDLNELFRGLPPIEG